ncbi:hypothetical protein [Polyangium sp. y55x31]|uniref:hypothetical protein n=1 Tax=Polyangium sp. y55x31 TaxID=3042688 RepID=UPI00248298D2|nr:hypothetical protein [Polyangium sp. y55x31]MDI1476205.1 hypothetical protein [Polyangium sp. y55x31]
MPSRYFASFILPAMLTGCTANQYATPRTIPRGQVSHTVALEGLLDFRFNGEPGDLHPRYQLRVGLADRVDLGVMAGPYFGADVKWNFVRTKYVDVAVTPGVYYSLFPSFSDGFDAPTHAVRFAAPISLGLNPTKAVTLFLHGNAAVNWNLKSYDEHCYPPDCERSSWFVAPEVGLGVQIRVTPNIALTPEVTIVGKTPHTAMAGLHGGLALTFGAQPSYDEFNEKPPD